DLALRLGKALLGLEDRHGARLALEEAARLDAASENNRGEIYKLLAPVCRDAGDASAAEAAFERAVALDPAFLAGHVGLGELRDARGADAEAATAFEAAVRLSPQEAKLYAALGSSLQKLGRFEESAERFAEAVKFGAGDPDILLSLGIGYFK